MKAGVPLSHPTVQVFSLWLGAYCIALGARWGHGTSDVAAITFVVFGASMIAIAATRSWPNRFRFWRVASWPLLAVGAGTLVFDSLTLTQGSGRSTRILIVLGLLVDVLIAKKVIGQHKAPGRLVAIWILVHTSLLGLILVTAPAPILDVPIFQQHAAEQLLEGKNPYALTFPDIFPPEDSARFYGEGISVNGELQFGYPYPPVTLLAGLVGRAIGDIRIAYLGMFSLAAWLLSSLGNASGTRSAVFLLFAPGVLQIFQHSWTETISILLLAALTVIMSRTPRLAPYALGVFLASKQYLVVLAPLAVLVRPKVSSLSLGNWLIRVAASAAAVTAPFFLWAPRDFMWSVVELQFHQPYRPDSLSLLAFSVERLSWPSPTAWSAIPIAVAIIPVWAVLRSNFRDLEGFALGSAIVIVAVVLVSKQAFINYYFFVVGAALCGAAAIDGGRQDAPRCGGVSELPRTPTR